MVHTFPVFQVLGPVILIFGATMLLPLCAAHLFADPGKSAYQFSVVITVAAGTALWIATRRYQAELQVRHGFLLVGLVWTVLPAFASLPLMIGIPGLSFTDAYFETVSAMTTTGATVIVGLDSLPDSINLWRAMLQWLGGMGVVVLAVAILPLLGVGGRQIFKAEIPGPMKDEKLTPRMAQTAKGLWTVYGILTVLCILAYRAAGMPWFDAVVHAFTTMPLGGYSNHDASFAFFDSMSIEFVSVVFMLIAGVNFSTHFSAFHRRTFAPYRKDPEALAFLLLLLFSCWGVAAYLSFSGTYPDILTAARYATFNVVSVATTTGYANTDYNQWPIFAPLWMLALCMFASCSGSTGGGMKMIRMQLLWRNAQRILMNLIHPRAHIVVKLRSVAIPNHIIFGTLAFAMMFGITTAVAVLLLTATGVDVVTATTGTIACITNTGPGLGIVGPAGNYASLSDFQKWVCTAVMLLGRLELFTLLILFTPAFWSR